MLTIFALLIVVVHAAGRQPTGGVQPSGQPGNPGSQVVPTNMPLGGVGSALPPTQNSGAPNKDEQNKWLAPVRQGDARPPAKNTFVQPPLAVRGRINPDDGGALQPVAPGQPNGGDAKETDTSTKPTRGRAHAQGKLPTLSAPPPVESDEQMQANVEDLSDVVPTDIPVHDKRLTMRMLPDEPQLAQLAKEIADDKCVIEQSPPTTPPTVASSPPLASEPANAGKKPAQASSPWKACKEYSKLSADVNNPDIVTPVPFSEFKVKRSPVQGATSETFIGERIKTSKADKQRPQKVVIKTSKLGTVEAVLLKNEMKVLSQLKSKNIMKMVAVVDYPGRIAYAASFIDGGNFNEYLNRVYQKYRKGLTESTARALFRPIVRALWYVHSLGRAHRDIKPDNLMLKYVHVSTHRAGKKLRSVYPVIIDWGFSTLDTEPTATSKRGTPAFASPEVLTANMPHDIFANDVYALGATMLSMVTKDFIKDADLACNGWLTRILPLHKKLSAEFRDLMQGMLATKKEDRLSMSDVYNHPWFLKPESSPEQNTNVV